jgi:hypothetical protein
MMKINAGSVELISAEWLDGDAHETLLFVTGLMPMHSFAAPSRGLRWVWCDGEAIRPQSMRKTMGTRVSTGKTWTLRRVSSVAFWKRFERREIAPSIAPVLPHSAAISQEWQISAACAGRGDWI